MTNAFLGITPAVPWLPALCPLGSGRDSTACSGRIISKSQCLVVLRSGLTRETNPRGRAQPVSSSSSDKNLPEVSHKRGVSREADGGKAVLDAVARDALAVALRKAGKRYKVWEFELGEDSYQQVLIWAEVSGLGREKVVEKAWKAWESQQSASRGSMGEFMLRYEFNSLIVFPEIVVNGTVDVTNVPALTELNCDNKQLTELDLSNLPALTMLSCDNTRLSELDLSNLPALEELYCQDSGLGELDLTNTPSLRKLHCGIDMLEDLNLSNVPCLLELRCEETCVDNLDLSRVPALEILICKHNLLTELDLSRTPNLTFLDCGGNHLKKLDLSNVPDLTFLDCYGNLYLRTLNLSNVPDLSYLSCEDNQISTIDASNCFELSSSGTIECDEDVVIIRHLDAVKYILDPLELGEESYKQILIWAEESGLGLEGLMEQLIPYPLSEYMRVEKGNITSVVLFEDQVNKGAVDLSHVSSLAELICTEIQLTKLNLTNVPALTELDCRENQITELDFTNVLVLAELSCSKNLLTGLN
jgi:Leucine-rich repeat (LRR) protein